jgi:hypothetical protein
METIKIIKDPDIKATFQDLFKGGYEVHKVQDFDNVWVVLEEDK